jgi:ADP-heptose:LPS heptosyltransferase
MRDGSVFVLHVGGLGDLVLASGALAALRASRPTARITLATRAAVAPLVAVSPLRRSVDAVVPLAINPYRWAAPSEALYGALERTFAVVARRPAETFVSAELRPTWLTFALAARLKPSEAVTLRSVDYSRALVGAVCERFGIAVPAFRRYADARSRTHELTRYDRLAKALGADAPARPSWPMPSRARASLKAFGLEPHSYIVCFPGGSPAAPGKRWPAERFIAALAAVRERLGGRVLLAGDATERELLEEVARGCTGAGLEAHVFSGGIADFAILRALGLLGQRYRLGSLSRGPRGARGRSLWRRHVAGLCAVGSRQSRRRTSAPVLRVFLGLHFRACRMRRAGLRRLGRGRPAGCRW